MVIINNCSVQESVANIIKQYSHHVNLPANSLLLTAGDINNKLYFVEKGLARAFYESNGNEYISWFVREGGFMYSVDGFLHGNSSRENIQLIEASSLRYITNSELQALLFVYPEIASFIQTMIKKDLLFYENRLRALRGFTPKQRLCQFQQAHPDLFTRLPLKYIASYLDMTASTLSRVRSELIRDERKMCANTRFV